ncbi:branched-chain amino acid aminotransferase [Spongisporangium articulatum]|uniref:Branched-chain-amino-acid aminotransferase n=1 Tax=Spongisporangium articulatum TaxID=3362603 RepID=A0ABW8AN78_9ACTN
MEISYTPNPNPATPEARDAVLAAPGFGKHFTDHMFKATWTADAGWHDAGVIPYGPLQLDPASAVLHYAQEIFEGLKAYKHADGTIRAFRPEANGERLVRSARRLALPELPVEDFVAAVEALVKTDRAWVDDRPEASLYLRPFMFASEVFLGVRPAAEVTFMVIASPAAAYFKGGAKPVSIWLSSEYTRAAPGGTGAAKCGGNYAASLAAMTEAAEHGCEQVCFLDAAESKYIEELGGMNIFLVHRDGKLITPELNGSILEGVTRSSILTLGKELGLDVEERRVTIDEWRDGVADGTITEVFACGTAAVVTPVGQLSWDGGSVGDSSAPAGEITSRIRDTLVDIQFGRAADPYGWMRTLA